MVVLALLPFVLFTLALAGLPLLEVLRMSLSEIQLAPTGFIFSWNGIQNYLAVLAEPEAWRAIWNTLFFTAATVLGSIVVGVIGALFVHRSVLLLKVARNVLIWPAVIAPVVVSLTWLLILSPTAGGLNKVLQTVGLPPQAWLDSGPGAMASVIVVDLWHWSPVVFLFVYTALQGISEDIFEAAKVDGADGWQSIRHIVLPLLAPAIGAVAVVRVIMGVKVFDEMYLLTAGGPNGATTLVSQRVQLWFFHDLRFGHAAAFSVVVVGFTAVVLGLVFLFRNQMRARA